MVTGTFYSQIKQNSTLSSSFLIDYWFKMIGTIPVKKLIQYLFSSVAHVPLHYLICC